METTCTSASPLAIRHFSMSDSSTRRRPRPFQTSATQSLLTREEEQSASRKSADALIIRRFAIQTLVPHLWDCLCLDPDPVMNSGNDRQALSYIDSASKTLFKTFVCDENNFSFVFVIRTLDDRFNGNIEVTKDIRNL